MQRYNRGGAYILVLVVMLAVFSMMILMLSVTSYERKVTAAYGGYAGLYSMAVSGAENALNVLNNQFRFHQDDFRLEAVERLKTGDKTGMLEYELLELDDVYGGEFYLSEDSISDIRTDFLQRVNDELSGGDVYIMESKLDTGNGLYSTVTEIKPIISGKNIYELISTVRKSDSGSLSAAQGYLQWREQSQRIKVIPTYKWKAVLPMFRYAIATFGELIADGDVEPMLYTEEEGNFDSLVISDMSLEQTSWQEDNPVFITDEPTRIDVSILYRNGAPVPSMLIFTGSGRLELYASEMSNNAFFGVVVSRGEVLLSSVDVTGNVLAAHDVIIDGANIYADIEMIFKIDPADKRLRRKLLDYLLITDFASITNRKTTGVGTILKNAALDEYFALEMRGTEDLALGMTKLKKIR